MWSTESNNKYATYTDKLMYFKDPINYMFLNILHT